MKNRLFRIVKILLQECDISKRLKIKSIRNKNHLSKKHFCANIATNVMTALFDVHELGLHSLGKEFSFCVCIQSFITWRKNKRC